jgi:two-component system OmpR family response regulator
MAAAAATAVRALVVEDDLDSCDALVAALNSHGFDTECARTVGEALVKLERGLIPAAIIVDMRLPDASGGLLLRRIHREKLHTKVAVVTGMPDPAAHPDLIRFPPDRIFTKPLDLHELLDWLGGLPD